VRGPSRRAAAARRGARGVIFTLRWFGRDDPVTLASFEQVPGLDGIVTALHDLPAGAVWTPDLIEARCAELAAHGFRWLVAESVPVSEPIKLGGPERDEHVAAWCVSLTNLAAAGVRTVCYNFMPVFDWIRTEFAEPLADGSTAMAYRHADLARFDFSAGMARLAAWAQGYGADELATLFARSREVGPDGLSEHLTAFLEDVVPVAEEVGVRLALHPDDPPWSVFGLPRVVCDRAGIARALQAVDSPANGLTFGTGALGAAAANDLVAMATEFADRIAFVHARNVRRTGPRDFHEVAHHPSAGDVDLVAVLERLIAAGVDVPLRPDHGRMLWGERAIPGYGLYDRCLGLSFLQGAAAVLRRP
jgi:mannonate dehydratase